MNAQLQIIVGAKQGRSFLKQSYFTQPFKLVNITKERSSGALHLMMMSSSPGVLSNDHYELKIQLEENAELHLTTQGYQRLFNMETRASQTVNVEIGENASFYYLPHPLVPHQGSSFTSLNNVYLANQHCLLWSEIITCGRKLSGEEFKFSSLKSITNIYLNNKLVVKECIVLEPLKSNVQAIGQLEGYTHQSSFLWMKDKAEIKCIMQECRQFLLSISDIEFGITELPVNGILIRMLGHKGEQLFECHKQLSSIIKALAVSVIRPELAV